MSESNETVTNDVSAYVGAMRTLDGVIRHFDAESWNCISRSELETRMARLKDAQATRVVVTHLFDLVTHATALLKAVGVFAEFPEGTLHDGVPMRDAIAHWIGAADGYGAPLPPPPTGATT